MQQHEDNMGPVIPLPLSTKATGGIFSLAPGTNIYVEAGNEALRAIGEYLADKLRLSTGYAFKVLSGADGPQNGNIHLTTLGGDPALGDEGYELTVTQQDVRLSAPRPAGVFRGIQTIRQLLPPGIDSSSTQPGPWTIPTGTIRDYPRFAWRGTMLDVARHFFKVEDVKRYIDLAAYYKMNYFHMHLTDDQGWRIEIKSWPKLAEIGGRTALGGGPGGYYTQEEYAEIVAYAQSRYITIVPEIDIPGHTHAALVAYPELNCDGKAPTPYTGMEVGFSSLCIQNDEVYNFVNDVVKELAALTPGPYIHIGGDEARATKAEDYIHFIERVQQIVQTNGKQAIGWDEIAQAKLLPTTIAQRWNRDGAHPNLEQATKVIMSPAAKAYLDLKYTELTPLGQNWAGYIEVPDGYQWDPATVMPSVSEDRVLGVEAPLWSETLETMDDIEMMAFPRLPGYAEIGWSPQASRSWDEYKVRLAAHGPRLSALGVNFHPSPQVPWK